MPIPFNVFIVFIYCRKKAVQLVFLLTVSSPTLNTILSYLILRSWRQSFAQFEHYYSKVLEFCPELASSDDS